MSIELIVSTNSIEFESISNLGREDRRGIQEEILEDSLERLILSQIQSKQSDSTESKHDAMIPTGKWKYSKQEFHLGRHVDMKIEEEKLN